VRAFPRYAENVGRRPAAREAGRADMSRTAGKLAVEVVAIFGPTGSGKSAVAQLLAVELGTEVVSTDALQVYRGLPILTNQPERPTRLVAICGLDEEMSVGAFAALAHAEIDELVSLRGAAVVAGGTGLYLRAALGELDVPPVAAPGARERWGAAYDASAQEAHAVLRSRDPAAAALVHPHDRRRVVRALELVEAGASLAPERNRLWSRETRRRTLVVGLELPAEALGDRIERRTAEMFRRGVVEEVRRALAGPVSRTAEKALGIREIAELEPELARQQIVARTRRYAAYQRKWMRRIPDIVMIDADRPPAEVADAILEVARAR
jgi:tRNA dimethylallyltransferase